MRELPRIGTLGGGHRRKELPSGNHQGRQRRKEDCDVKSEQGLFRMCASGFDCRLTISVLAKVSKEIRRFGTLHDSFTEGGQILLLFTPKFDILNAM